MRRAVPDIWFCLLGLLIATTELLQTGCSDTDVPDMPTSYYDVTFTIRTGTDDATRANADGITRAIITEEAGEAYENYINPSSLRVYVFNGSGSLNGSSTYLTKISIEGIVQSANDPQLYYITGKIDSVAAAKVPFKIVALANWYVSTDGSMNTGTTIDGLTIWNGAFACNQPFTPSKDTPIPMFGIKTFTKFTYCNDKPSDFGMVDMVRAVAKIVVKSNDSLTDVRLTRAYNVGQAAPYGIYQYTSYSTPSNINLTGDRANYINQNNYKSLKYSLTVLKDVPFVRLDSTGWKNYYVLYVPEYVNDPTYTYVGNARSYYGTTPIPDTIRFKMRGEENFVEFKNYQTKGIYNILRNYKYDYQIETATIFYWVSSMSNRTASPITFD